MTPEELELLQQQQAGMGPTPYQLPEEPGMFSALHDTLFDPTQKVGTGMDVNGQVSDLPPTTDVPPLVAAPSPPIASEHDRLAAAKVILGTDGVMQKTGEKTTQTNQTIESDETKQAQADMEQAQADQQKATDMELQSVSDQANVAYQKEQELNSHIAEIENARVAVHQEKMVQLEQTMQDIDSRVAELSNYKPETFWGSKSQSDKIQAAISVGLGSFAQALLGSKENVGQILLQRKMDEFDTNQKAQYDAKVKAIENMRADISVKRNLLDDLDKTYDAQKIASNAQVQAQFAKASAMAKTPQVQAAILQKQATFDQKAAMDKAQIAQKYEKTIMTSTKQDVISRVKAGSAPQDRKEIDEQVKSINASTTSLVPIRGEIATALKQLQDPKLSDEQKYQVAQGIIKTMNSTQGKDAVGADERAALASELETSFGNIGTAVKYGAGAGATIGAAAAGVPSLGLGAIPGAGIGAVVGGGLSGAGAAINEAFKPGGIKFSPQIGTFTQRTQLILDKLDGTLSRNDKIKELIKQGIPASKAAVMVDTEPK